MRTCCQSQSSSSATIIGSDVFTPCPISGFFATIVTVPSGATDMKAESSAIDAAPPSPVRVRPVANAGTGIRMSSARPPPANKDALRTVRRPTHVFTPRSRDMAALRFGVGSDLNRSANPLIAPAAADVASHCAINLAGSRSGRLCEQRARSHDLPGLAVATLHHIDLQPRLLQASANRGRTNVLDRVNLRIADTFDRQLTGALRSTLDMDRAGSAQPLAASIFGANQTQLIAQHPQQWHVPRNVYFPDHAIDIESIRHSYSSSAPGQLSAAGAVAARSVRLECSIDTAA